MFKKEIHLVKFGSICFIWSRSRTDSVWHRGLFGGLQRAQFWVGFLSWNTQQCHSIGCMVVVAMSAEILYRGKFIMGQNSSQVCGDSHIVYFGWHQIWVCKPQSFGVCLEGGWFEPCSLEGRAGDFFLGNCLTTCSNIAKLYFCCFSPSQT